MTGDWGIDCTAMIGSDGWWEEETATLRAAQRLFQGQSVPSGSIACVLPAQRDTIIEAVRDMHAVHLSRSIRLDTPGARRGVPPAPPKVDCGPDQVIPGDEYAALTAKHHAWRKIADRVAVLGRWGPPA